jgi:hypothetical protein
MKIVCWSESLQGGEKKLEKYRLDLMVVQEVRWDKGEAECAVEYTLFCGKEIKIISGEQDICTYRQLGQ